MMLVISVISVAGDSDRVQQALGFLFGQQSEPRRGPQEDGGGAPPGGGDGGPGHFQKLRNPSRTLAEQRASLQCSGAVNGKVYIKGRRPEVVATNRGSWSAEVTRTSRGWSA